MQWKKTTHQCSTADDSHLSCVRPSRFDCFFRHLLWYIVNKVVITEQRASSEAWGDWKVDLRVLIISHHSFNLVPSWAVDVPMNGLGYHPSELLRHLLWSRDAHYPYICVILWNSWTTFWSISAVQCSCMVAIALHKCFILVVANKQQHQLTEHQQLKRSNGDFDAGTPE